MAGIRIEGLSKTYGGKDAGMAAVSDLDLDIRDNQFVTLLGPSGCGKTTTLRLIAGYIKPDAGTIRVDDRLLSSVDGMVPPERRGMGMVFQNYAVWPHKTVFENVVFGLKLRKVPSAEARESVGKALELVNLSGLEARYPNELSGGQQQRVALARSLVVEPDILLLDEPLSNLDAKLRERMRTELKQLQRRTGITFVYVTHDQAEALAISDHIAVIHGGRLQQYGTPNEVYAKPANKTVADFMGLINVLTAKVSGAGTVLLDNELALPVAPPPGCNLGEIVDLTVRPECIRLLTSPGGTGIIAATVSDQTFLGNLNEYYVTLKSGQTLRVQTHPRQRLSMGDSVGVAIDAAECSIFRREAAASVL
jgi:iron(III) transport system ATP-binding protein